MRKFSARWWVTPDLIQWRYMVECGDYFYPFWRFPFFPNPQGADSHYPSRSNPINGTIRPLSRNMPESATGAGAAVNSPSVFIR